MPQDSSRLIFGSEVERWLPIPGWEDEYEVSDLGRVRSLERLVETSDGRLHPVRGRVLNPSRRAGGYRYVNLKRPGVCEKRSVHLLVLLAHVGPRPDGQETRHLDGNPENNRLDNLKYGTRVENAADKVRHGTLPLGERCGTSVLTREEVQQARRIYASGRTLAEVARELDVGLCTIHDIISGRTWSHLEPEGVPRVRRPPPKRSISPETRAKISASMMGHPTSAETRAKISAAARERHRKRSGGATRAITTSSSQHCAVSPLLQLGTGPVGGHTRRVASSPESG